MQRSRKLAAGSVPSASTRVETVQVGRLSDAGRGHVSRETAPLCRSERASGLLEASNYVSAVASADKACSNSNQPWLLPVHG
jgi:hypothetical protein